MLKFKRYCHSLIQESSFFSFLMSQTYKIILKKVWIGANIFCYIFKIDVMIENINGNMQKISLQDVTGMVD